MMKTVAELDDKELRQAYVIACEQYDNSYKEKKSIEEEMRRRFKKELEENR